LLAYVRGRLESGKRVGREEPMRRFGCTREAIDKARAHVLADIARTPQQECDEALRLVAKPGVWELFLTAKDAEKKTRAAGRIDQMHGDLVAREKAKKAEEKALQEAEDPKSSIAKGEADLLRAGRLIDQLGGFIRKDSFWRAHREPIIKLLHEVIDLAHEAIDGAGAPMSNAPRETVNLADYTGGEIIDLGEDAWEDPSKRLAIE
jgi:hypothetical protein